MSRTDTESEIVEALGQIPDFLASMPDTTLTRAWGEFKQLQLGDTALTAREKHLIGYAVAAAILCPSCTYFHHSATQMMGTTDGQVEDAARLASDTAFYTTYIHAQGTGLDESKQATDDSGEHSAAKAAEAARQAA